MSRNRLLPSVARTLFVALVATILGNATAPAANVTFSTGDSPFLAGTNNQGWWSNTLSNTDDNDFWEIGVFQETQGFTYHDTRAFFTFDLTSLEQDVESATLRLTATGYDSPNVLENVELFDVSTDAATLNDTDTATGDATIYGDLGSGTSFGEFVVDQPAEGSGDFTLGLNLNPAGVAALNAARGGFFSVGAALTSIDSFGDAQEVIFGQAGSPQFLDVVIADEPPPPPPGGVIPLPAGVVGGMAMLGMLGIGGVRKWRQRR